MKFRKGELTFLKGSTPKELKQYTKEYSENEKYVKEFLKHYKYNYVKKIWKKRTEIEKLNYYPKN